MKQFSLALVLLLGVGLASCQRPAAPERTADAPSPAATVTPAVPPEAPPAPATPMPAAPTPAARTRPGTSSRPLPEEPAPAPVAVAPPASVPAPVPTPTPTPPPPRVVASGTPLTIVLKQAVSTKTAQPEDRVVAELAEDVVADGDVLLPAGSEVLGRVVTSVRSGRVKGRARLVVSFDRIRVDGRTLDIDATRFDVTADSSKGKDAKIAGGAAAAGAVIGAIADGGEGALKGGLIGGAAGGAAVLATRGKEVELPAGSRYKIELTRSLRLN